MLITSKKYTYETISSIYSGFAVCAVQTFAAQPLAAPLSPNHNFGNIAEKGGRVSCEFKVVNTGDKPLVFISATAACGCTKPKVPKQPVAPGDTAVVVVSYDLMAGQESLTRRLR